MENCVGGDRPFSWLKATATSHSLQGDLFLFKRF